MRLWSGLLLALGVAASLPAQRAPIAGRVVDANGEPCPGWRVIGVGRAIRIAPELDTLDRVEASTSARGTFRVAALVGVDYDLWGVGPADQDGLVGVTAIAHLRAPGSIVQLRATAKTRPLMVEIVGADAWADDGPFSVVAIPDTFSLPGFAATPIGDAFLLPPLPGPHVSIEVRDRRGEVIAADRAARVDRGRDDGALEVRIPPPVEFDAVVHEADGGAPIDGAEIRWATDIVFAGKNTGTFLQRAVLRRWRVVGRTDADGRATLRVPCRDDPRADTVWQFWLAASADGYADSHSGWQSRKPFVDGAEQDSHGPDGVVRFTLAPSRGWSTTVRDLDGPVAGVRVVVEATSKIARSGGWTHLPRRFVAESDADGRIAVPEMPLDAYRFELVAELPAELRAAWRREAEHAGPFPTYAAMITRAAEPGAEPPPFVIDGGRTVQVQVLDRSGGPARDARVLVAPIRDDVQVVPELPLLTRTDASGRFALRLADEPLLLVVLHDAGYAIRELDRGASDGGADITLAPFDVLRIDVVAGSGPVVGARVDVVGSSRSYAGPGQPAEQLIDQLLQQVSHRSLERGRSDERGRMELEFVARRNLGYRLRVSDGSRTGPQIEVDGLPDGDAPILVELK